MDWKKYVTMVPLIFELFNPLKATDLEFLASDTLNNPLPGATIVMQGISDPAYFESQETDSVGSTTFDVEQNNFFYYFGFKSGYHPENGSIFSNGDTRISSDQSEA